MDTYKKISKRYMGSMAHDLSLFPDFNAAIICL